MKRTLIIILSFIQLLVVAQLHAQQTIFINEVMASNSYTIADTTGDYSDWIELYNSGSSDFSLTNCFITDDSHPLYLFTGNLQIPANGFILIWASGDVSRGATHVPFKLSASGDGVFLYAPDGTTVLDSLSFGIQKADVSYGRLTDGSSTLKFFAKPTPAATNNTSTGYNGILNPPVFSVAAGFYPAPFSLALSTSDAGAKIVYTLDGSLPNAGGAIKTAYRYKNNYPQNPGNPVGKFLQETMQSLTYTKPVQIKDDSIKKNKLSAKSTTFDKSPSSYVPKTLVNKGTVVRAIVTKAGYIPSEVVTNTYFVKPNGINKYTLPVVSLAIEPSHLFSWDSGIYCAGTDFEKWRQANPNTKANGGSGANYVRETEYPLSIELFKAGETTRQLGLNAGVSIHGHWSRSKMQKSLTLSFRDEYGSSDFNYPIFTNLPYDHYKRLLLSNSGSEMTSSHFRDMSIQQALKHLDFDIQEGQPAIAFIDGEFWGLLNFRQRVDKFYFEQEYGLGETEFDYLENNARTFDGDSLDYLNMRNFIKNNDMTNPQNYDSVKHRMDVNNFIDYQTSEIFIGNTDWPGNNIGYFRKRIPYDSTAPKGLDGRYRWLLFDTDFGLGYGGNQPADNSLHRATGNLPLAADAPPSWSTQILNRLLTNVDFRNQFITRYADLLNTNFLPDYINPVVKYYHDLQLPHENEHILRWNNPGSLAAWDSIVNIMTSYASQRPAYARQHVRSEFGLSPEQQLTLNVSDSAKGYIHINTFDLTSSFAGVPANVYPWSGLYFPEVPVTLIAKPKPGFLFVGWQGDTTSTTDTLIVSVNVAKSFVAVFDTIPKKVDTALIVDYWHFNNISTSPLTTVPADSTLTGNAIITYDGTGAGYMDSTSNIEGSMLNAQFSQPAGKALRARNPSNTRVLLITVPTTGYKNIMLKYASTRTSKGAQYQRVSYTRDSSLTWILKQDSILVVTPETTFGVDSFDFSNDSVVNNNAGFAVKIEFFGSQATGSSGNNRFDNISISGFADDTSGTMQRPLLAKAIYPAAIGTQSLVAIGIKNNNSNNLKIIPNPVQSAATIIYHSAKQEQVTIAVRTDGGQTIQTLQQTALKGSNVYILNTASWAKGVYLISVQTEGMIVSKKIIKE